MKTQKTTPTTNEPNQPTQQKPTKPSKAIYWGYCRVSTHKQDLSQQRLQLLEWGNGNGVALERIIECTSSAKRSANERSIDILMEAAATSQVTDLVFPELSRLGRSISEIVRHVEYFTQQYHVCLHFVKERMTLPTGKQDMQGKVMLSMFSLLAEIERDLISERTKAGLAAKKAQGVRLGRPAMKSKLDPYELEIKKLLRLGVTQKALCQRYKCTEATMSKWLKRKRKEWKEPCQET